MKRRSWVSVLCQVLLIFAAFWALIAVVRSNSNNYISVNSYIDSDIVYMNGETLHVNDKNFGEVNKGDVVTMHLRLPEEPLLNNGTLVFYDFNTVTEIWFDGNLLDSYGEEIAAKGMMIGNHDFFIDIPDRAWGSEITITLHPTANNAFSNFTNMKIYPASDAYRYYIDSDPAGFVVSLALLVFGVVGVIACLFGGIHNTSMLSGMFLSLFALLTALWMISNKGIYNMFAPADYFWQPLEYMTGYTIAIPLLLFYRGTTDQSSKWKKIFGMLAAIIGIVFSAATVLNFTNILHYDELANVPYALLFISGVLLLIYTLQIKAKGDKTKSLLRSGMFFFLLTCLYEVVIREIYSWIPLAELHNLPSFIAVGVLCLFVCLIAFFVSDLYDKQTALLVMQVKADTLSHVIDTTPAGLCQLVPGDEITIVSANNIFYKIMGYRDAELQKGKPQDAFAHLFDNEQIVLHDKIAEILQSPSNEGEFEFTTVDIDKKPLTVLFRYYYDREDSGNITVNAIDITDRKRMEEDLRLSEERYKLALNQSGKVFFFFDVQTKTMQLSEELAEAFGLPLEVDHMPDNFIATGLVESESIENYRHFYERIYAGEKQGETIISCHMRKAPEQVLWYRIAFTSVFDNAGAPSSSIITYEDISEQYRLELQSKWKQINLISIPEQEYVIAIYDLTRNHLISQTGELFVKLPAFEESYDGINRFVLENFIYSEDVEALGRFLDISRLRRLYQAGTTEDTIEYRSLQSGSDYRWTSLTVQMITDPYTGHIMAQLLFQDIHKGKSGQIEITQNMQKLQKELDNSRIKVMIGQMQPHFLYNALSAIKMITRSDPKRAYNLIQDFTVHLRSSIHALSSDEPIPFTEEMNNVRAYLNIELARFGDKLHIVYDIRCDDFAVIPLTIQPLVENAVKHGIFPKGKKGGTVTVRSYETNDAYIVEVEDDGLGFDMDKAMEEGNNSYGLKNIVFRLKSLMQADVVFHSTIGTGTLAVVTFPKATQRGVVSE